MKESIRWRKSSYSGNQTDCVEITLDRVGAGVRDTKARGQGHLEVSAQAWRSMLERL